jgi:alkylation response protein AidB-like acyl-CoA dehydrogenase
MTFEITSQQRQMIATVRALAQSEFKADAIKYMDGSFPWENMKKLAKLGMSVPEEYGGMGLPVFDTALILEEIAKVDYVTAMAVLGEAGVQTRVIAKYAPEQIKRRILPKVCAAECILAICMTEPHAGTDVANYKTNAAVKNDHVVLNGTRTLISRAAEAGMFVVFTRIDGRPGREGIGCHGTHPRSNNALHGPATAGAKNPACPRAGQVLCPRCEDRKDSQRKIFRTWGLAVRDANVERPPSAS